MTSPAIDMAFAKAMEGIHYGVEETKDAKAWFADGFNARHQITLEPFGSNTANFNSCLQRAIEALRYIGTHGRTRSGGNEFPNDECCFDIAHDLENTLAVLQSSVIPVHSMGWISIDERLPDESEWVQLLENDYIDPYEVSIQKLVKNEPRYRVVPGKLSWVEADGYPHWYLVDLNGRKHDHTRNVTHWKPLDTVPVRVEEEDV